ncbi:AAA domain-containing protein [Bacillus sp. DX1.1]|uniref:AAA domain-containing protein n=1 Tax=unclassified Bacillus (in: firmicutes) TaxID=185979 RepID=UPI00257127BE|nr:MULTISPECIES: AAA domain-containing protein [unclassified Bacillus (in: firmicutes)]MDM5154896.1 AAA domain-containing protein [Bacillus sp. DX1.1]WJE83767.1 AAA domain-containing protein [Bacillus sp. DX3.1]
MVDAKELVKELVKGDPVNQSFDIVKSEVKQTKKGTDYLFITLKYGNFTIIANRWNCTEEDKNIFANGVTIWIKGSVTEFKGNPQIEIDEIKLHQLLSKDTKQEDKESILPVSKKFAEPMNNQNKSHEMVTYFRNSLADAERISPDASRIHISILDEYENIKKGYLAEEKSKEIFKKAEQVASKGKKVMDPVEVVVNPFVGYRKSFYGQDINSEGAPEELVPFWLPALLYKNGKLSPHPMNRPWVAREWLRASSTDSVRLDYQTIGEIDSVDVFLSSHKADFKTWSEVWDYVDKLSIAVTGEKMAHLKHPTYVRGGTGQNCYVRLVEIGQGMTRNIMGVYNDLIGHKKDLPPLLERYVSVEDEKEIDILSGQEYINRTEQHVGQMSDKFPVSGSQRQAIHHFSTMQDSEILAVNGPPGTGKTTMLQSIVATMWTRAAVEKKQPPVIFVASTNNNAVTNVIESFGKVEEIDSPTLAGRWLPQINSYGLYLVREKKEGAEAFQCYHPINKTNLSNGLPHLMEDSTYVLEAEKYFLEKYNQYTGAAITDVNEAVTDLHDKLIQTVQRIEGQTKVYVSISDNSEFMAKMDTNERYQAFKLATHYFEGQWILEMKQELNRDDAYLALTLESQQNKWHRFAKITPCFVSTMHMTPSFFRYGLTSIEYLYDFIDLLIVDEAGQVNPEVAGATFALAKKALVVGDTVQIPPIWNIPLTIDFQNLMKLGIVCNEKEALKLIQDTYLGASSGSVMKIAQRASKYRIEKSLARGMFLKEHRRCVKDIISYCNRLAYNGFLEPFTKEFETNTFILPHMGYAHIEGSHDNTNGNSNIIEAEAIITWINQNRKFLEEYYSNYHERKVSIDEIIGIITPFTKQTSVFKKILSKQDLGKLTVGTVHALQGGERNICIFSPVYDVNHEGSYFFDNGVNMLNVAVSRAKHSFLVFGDTRIFSQTDHIISSKKTPSGLLGEYILNDSNEINLTKSLDSSNVSNPYILGVK